MSTVIYIGKSYNLLDEFDAHNMGLAEAEQVLEEPLKLSHAVSESDSEIAWDNLQLTLLTTNKALVEYVGLYDIPLTDYDGKGCLISPNLLNEKTEEEQLKVLSNKFGVQFNSDSNYVVLELRRKDYVRSHEVFNSGRKATFDREKHLSKKWGFDSLKVRPGKKISHKEYFDTELNWARAQKYIDSFYKYGTHFVSNITYGDRILQFFEIKASSLARIENLYKDINKGLPLVGNQAGIFNVFLCDQYCLSISNIISLAKDNGVGEVLKSGLLKSVGSANSNLILASSWNKEILKVNLQALTESIETQVSLCSLGRLTGYFRSINYDRILKGALAQRWGRKVTFPIKRLNNVTPNLQAINSLPNTQLRITDSIFRFGDTFDGSQIRKNETDLNLFRVISLKDHEEDFYLENTSFSCQFLEGASITSKATKIMVSEEQFTNPPIFCGKMYGSFILVNKQSKEENIIYDGYRFGERKSTINGSKEIYLVNDILDPKATFKQSMVHMVDTFTDLLSVSLTTQGLDVEDVKRMKSFLVWLADATAVSFDGNLEVADRCKYFGNSKICNAFSEELSESENLDLLPSMNQFLEKCWAIDRYNATIYNFRSLGNESKSDEYLNDLLPELQSVEKNVSLEYRNLIDVFIAKEYDLFLQKNAECDSAEREFRDVLLRFKPLLEKSNNDEIVDHLLFFLSKTTDQSTLFLPHKNLIKSRFEEDEIADTRNFTSLLSNIQSDFMVYDQIREDLIENKEGISKMKHLKYVEEIDWTKDMHLKKYDALFLAIKKILIEETRSIANNEFHIDEILHSFSKLFNCQDRMHRSIRVLLDLKLNLSFAVIDKKRNMATTLNIWKVNALIAKVQYYRNTINLFRSNIHIKMKEKEGIHQLVN